jgi:hypothetical protein
MTVRVMLGVGEQEHLGVSISQCSCLSGSSVLQAWACLGDPRVCYGSNAAIMCISVVSRLKA